MTRDNFKALLCHYGLREGHRVDYGKKVGITNQGRLIKLHGRLIIQNGNMFISEDQVLWLTPFKYTFNAHVNGFKRKVYEAYTLNWKWYLLHAVLGSLLYYLIFS